MLGQHHVVDGKGLLEDAGRGGVARGGGRDGRHDSTVCGVAPRPVGRRSRSSQKVPTVLEGTRRHGLLRSKWMRSVTTRSLAHSAPRLHVTGRALFATTCRTVRPTATPARRTSFPGLPTPQWPMRSTKAVKRCGVPASLAVGACWVVHSPHELGGPKSGSTSRRARGPLRATRGRSGTPRGRRGGTRDRCGGTRERRGGTRDRPGRANKRRRDNPGRRRRA